MLSACRRVARPGAAMVFTSLMLPSGLSASEREQASAVTSAGWVTASAEMHDAVRGAGWRLQRRLDVTRGYEATARRVLRADETRAARLERALGREALAERLETKRRYLAAIADGLLGREMYVLSA